MSENESLIPSNANPAHDFRLVGDIVHVVSDDKICVAGIVSLTHKGNADIVRITLCIPIKDVPAVCIGDVRRDDECTARTWHDMFLCKNSQAGKKRRVLVS